ncbi:hypothetical protein D3C76_1845240 [compost metagenome]
MADKMPGPLSAKRFPFGNGQLRTVLADMLDTFVKDFASRFSRHVFGYGHDMDLFAFPSAPLASR